MQCAVLPTINGVLEARNAWQVLKGVVSGWSHFCLLMIAVCPGLNDPCKYVKFLTELYMKLMIKDKFV